MPWNSASSPSTAMARWPAARAMRDGVGEIELALHVVVADRPQQGGDQRAVEAHHAGIAEIDRLLALVGVRLSTIFSSAPRCTISRPYGVGSRAMKPSTPTAAFALRQAATRRLQGRRRHQRRIGIDHQHRPAMSLERAQRRLGGIAGAERPALHGRRMRREGRGDIAWRPGDTTPTTRAGFSRRHVIQHMAHHRPAGQRMQDLGECRFHARAGPGCQHHHGDGRFHGRPMPWGWRSRKADVLRRWHAPQCRQSHRQPASIP